VSLIILIAWDKVPFKEIKINSRCINSSNFSIVLNEIFILSGSSLAFQTHLVTLPVPTSLRLKAIVITLIFRAFESSSMDRWINDCDSCLY
jgi:hypothetical protein